MGTVYAEHAYHSAAFARMPLALRPLPAWGFYTAKKLPVRLYDGVGCWAPRIKDPSSFVRVNDASTWATFEGCRGAPQNRWLIGPAFVFSSGWGLVAIDVDDPIRSLRTDQRYLAYDAEGQTRVLARAHACNRAIIEIAREHGMFIELSMSGKGAHILAFAQTEHPTYTITYGGNIFTKSRYFAMTGNLIRGSASDVTRQQAGMDAIVKFLDHCGALEPQKQLSAYIADEAQTMTDEEVLAKLPSTNRASWAAYHG